MDKAPIFVGIDVSKRRLDIHSRPSGESSTFGYDDENVAALIERLVAVGPTLIVLEATGGMEVRLAAALAAAVCPAASAATVYAAAAVAEIAGCFVFWAWLRLRKSAFWLVPGLVSLVAFAWLLTPVRRPASG